MGSYINNDKINSCKMIYDFDSLLTNKEFEAFNSKMFELDKINKMNHTMIGFNYNIEQIISTKFYYTFYSDSNIDKSFPIPELNEVYKNVHLKISNYHLKEKFVPGGGITFVIKFDNSFNVTRGFFFRVNDDNRKLINNLIRLYPELNFTLDDFENGFGQYVLINKNGIEYNEYLYLKNNEISEIN